MLIFISISAVWADENATDDANPVEDIGVSYGDIYGDVLLRDDDTYDLYISHIPDGCEADEFKLYIDNETVNYTVIEYERSFNQIYGQYKYHFTNSSHILKLEFTGNSHYRPCAKTFTFNATQAIIYIPTTATQGISADRSVEVYLADNVRGKVTITADGKSFEEREISQRLTRFPLDSLGFGSHDVEVTFENITKSKRVEVTYYFSVDFYGDEEIAFTLPWDATKTPTVRIDGKEYTYANRITYTEVGTHFLTATYPGDGKYPAKTINATFTIKGEDKIVASQAKIYMNYMDSKTVKFTVYGLDRITIRIGTYSTTVQVKNNTAILRIPNLKPGTYTIAATGKLLYAKTDLVVKHVLSLTRVSVKKSAKKLTLTATLKAGSAPIKYKQVTFIFKGKKYIKKTNSKGVAKVTIPKSVLSRLKVGSSLTYKAIYGKDTAQRTVKVLK